MRLWAALHPVHLNPRAPSSPRRTHLPGGPLRGAPARAARRRRGTSRPATASGRPRPWRAPPPRAPPRSCGRPCARAPAAGPLWCAHGQRGSLASALRARGPLLLLPLSRGRCGGRCARARRGSALRRRHVPARRSRRGAMRAARAHRLVSGVTPRPPRAASAAWRGQGRKEGARIWPATAKGRSRVLRIGRIVAPCALAGAVVPRAARRAASVTPRVPPPVAPPGRGSPQRPQPRPPVPTHLSGA
jgi:hypothetical protein